MTHAELEVEGQRHPVELATTFRQRSTGLLGRQGLAGALAIRPASSVHTLCMRFPIDVAFVRRNGTVTAVVHMPPWRLGLPRPRTHYVLEAEPGVLKSWGVRRGARVRLVEQP